MLTGFGILLICLGLFPFLYSMRSSMPRVMPVHLAPLGAGLLFGFPPVIYRVITGEEIISAIPFHSQFVEEGVFSIGVFVTLLAVLAILLGESRRHPERLTSTFHRLSFVSLSVVLPVAATVWTVRVVLATRYGVFYAGSGSEVEIPYFLTVGGRISQLLAVGVVLWAIWSVSTASSGTRKIVAIILLLVEVPYLFTQGRREMLFFAAISAVVYLYARRRFTLKHILIGVGIVSALGLGVFPLYQATRVGVAQDSRGDAAPAPVSRYFEGVLTAARSSDIRELYTSNLIHRMTAYYSWQTQLASFRKRGGSLNGKLAVSGIRYSVPRFLIEDKYDLAWGEQVVRRAYGSDVRDIPNSVVSAGFADFGMWGVILYGGSYIVLIWLGTGAGLAVAKRSPLFGVAFIGAVMLLAIRAEMSMVGVFATVRDLLLFGGISAILGIAADDFSRRITP